MKKFTELDGTTRQGLRKEDKNDVLRRMTWTFLCGTIAVLAGIAVTWAQGSSKTISEHGERLSALEAQITSIDATTERIWDSVIRQDIKLDRILEKL